MYKITPGMHKVLLLVPKKEMTQGLHMGKKSYLNLPRDVILMTQFPM